MKLYTKVVLSVGGVVALGGAAVAGYSQRAVHGALVSEMVEHARRELSKDAAGAAAAMGARDENRLLSILHRGAETTGAVHAAALDPEGRVLAHSDVARVGHVQDDSVTRAMLAVEEPRDWETVEGGRRLVHVFVPVYAGIGGDGEFLLASESASARGARVGTLQLALPLEQTMAVERRIAMTVGRWLLVLGAAVCLVLLGVMRRLLEPLHYLRLGTLKIGGGDYCAHVPVTSDDELGDLARSFNRMTRELAMTTVSKQFFNDILDGIQEILIVSDERGRVARVNPAACAALGWSAEELTGRPAQSLLAEGSAPFDATASNASAHLVGRSGERLPVLLSTSPIKDADGNVTGWIGAARDVRDVRQLEARMRQSEKLSAVGQLAAGVAHEINNPLGVILGFAQGMAHQLKAGDGLELPIRSIEREALRCKALVQNLLTFARATQPDRVPMPVNPAVEQALALVAPQARMARVVLRTELADALPPVLGNKNQLEQIVLNLSKNAIDAMPNGGSLVLRTELAADAPHSWVCLRVEDDGAGIPADVLPRIFDPFFTTKPVGQGTGLGLSLVSEIVQKHSGELSVDSRPGRTVFTVRLPVRTGDEMERLSREERALTHQAAGAKGSISHG